MRATWIGEGWKQPIPIHPTAPQSYDGYKSYSVGWIRDVGAKMRSMLSIFFDCEVVCCCSRCVLFSLLLMQIFQVGNVVSFVCCCARACYSVTEHVLRTAFIWFRWCWLGLSPTSSLDIFILQSHRHASSVGTLLRMPICLYPSATKPCTCIVEHVCVCRWAFVAVAAFYHI